MGWVRRIIVNTCIDHCRRQTKFTHNSIDQVADDHIALNPDIYERFSAQDVIQRQVENLYHYPSYSEYLSNQPAQNQKVSNAGPL